jgi:hypothetical protein
MQLKTILNRVQKFKSFVYTGVRWAGGGDTPELEVEVAQWANGRARCSGCGCPGPGYPVCQPDAIHSLSGIT